jgi:hypothetical protein
VPVWLRCRSSAADEPDDEFVFGLDRILDGVRVVVERTTP